MHTDSQVNKGRWRLRQLGIVPPRSPWAVERLLNAAGWFWDGQAWIEAPPVLRSA